MEVGFLGGAQSPRPDCKALLMPRHFITGGGWPGGRCLMETCVGQAGSFLAGVRSPPLRGGTIRARKALRWKPGDNIEVGFLGGARSPRPQIRGQRKPRHNLDHGRAKRTPGGLEDTCLGQARALLAGVGSPPLQGDNPRQDGLTGKARKWRQGWFSRRGAVSAPALQGRTSAVAFHSHPGGGERRVAYRGYVSQKPVPSLRACRARPSRGTIQGKMALWGKARKWRQGWFSRRGAVSASGLQGRTSAVAFHSHPVGGREAGGLPGTCLGQARALLAGVRSPPLQGWRLPGEMA